MEVVSGLVESADQALVGKIAKHHLHGVEDRVRRGRSNFDCATAAEYLALDLLSFVLASRIFLEPPLDTSNRRLDHPPANFNGCALLTHDAALENVALACSNR